VNPFGSETTESSCDGWASCADAIVGSANAIPAMHNAAAMNKSDCMKNSLQKVKGFASARADALSFKLQEAQAARD
jgi:hypothetical protein